MTYGRYPYGGATYAGGDVAQIPQAQTQTTLAVEVAFTTDPLAEPAWVDITTDVRSWSAQRGRTRELERFQPGRATVVLSNRERQYDSLHATGPWFGNIKPMKRMRIRETFAGVTYPVFDGFVDKWQLAYPGKNKDATATITATDAFKHFARTNLARSVYFDEVDESAPLVWYRLDDDKDVTEGGKNAVNWGSAGTTHDGLAEGGPIFKETGLVVKDLGAAMTVINDQDTSGTHLMGLRLPNATMNLLAESAFTVEGWFRVATAEGATGAFVAAGVSRGADASGHMAAGYVNNTGLAENLFQFVVINSALTTSHGVQTPANSVIPGKIYHYAAVMEASGVMTIYLNAVPSTTIANGATTNTRPGVVPTNGDFAVGHSRANSEADQSRNWQGQLSNVAVYFRALSSSEIAAHYAAGSAPLNGDLVGVRMGRYLDEASWPANLREIDAGLTTFQSDEWNVDVLEKLQKAAESEYAGELFITRDGKVRFIGRTAILAREPYPIAFGDDAGEVGYTEFVPDDGEFSIRNRATISRLNGVAKTVEDATSIGDFGRFDFVLDGLMFDSETTATAYAQFVVDQFKSQRRRVQSIELGPAIVGEEATLYPAMLSLELTNAITVINEPLGGGTQFSQVCVVEGIEHSGEPKNALRTCRLTLSPDYT